MGKNHLTNESLNKKFDSPFNLVNHAIKLARIRIAKGESYASNVAIEVLEYLEEECDPSVDFEEEVVVD